MTAGAITARAGRWVDRSAVRVRNKQAGNGPAYSLTPRAAVEKPPGPPGGFFVWRSYELATSPALASLAPLC